MIDGEVIRLRRLRDAALRSRALAAVMESYPPPRNPLFSRGAQTCWQIARLITGKLRAHPTIDFQRGPSAARAVYDGLGATVQGAMARYRGRSVRFYSAELRRVARELDDARALTWSPDLSDDLGRLQTRMRRVLRELEVAELVEAGAGARGHMDARSSEARSDEARSRIEARGLAASAAADVAGGHWPYLAF